MPVIFSYMEHGMKRVVSALMQKKPPEGGFFLLTQK
jgi:hypothetical protein